MSQNGGDKAEGCWQGGFACGNDFMEGAAGEPAVRQVGIEGGKTEGQGLVLPAFQPWQHAAQLRHYCGALLGGTYVPRNRFMPSRCRK